VPDIRSWRLCCVRRLSGKPAVEREAVTRSDYFGEFAEGFDQPVMGRGFGSEFVVATSDVLGECVAANHDRRGAVAFESAHWF
jgi:hypothetical protein